MYVHEPDNDTLHPLAVFGVRNVGHVATLEPSQLAPAYEALWLAYLEQAPSWRGSGSDCSTGGGPGADALAGGYHCARL